MQRFRCGRFLVWTAASIAILVMTAQTQPLQNRLLLATSRDGLNFTKQNLLIYNEADVPDAVVDSSGRVFLYFQGNQPPVTDAIMVGTSRDGVLDWSFQPVKLIGIQQWKVRPCDPDVIYRNGIFRLYVTGDPLNDRVPETYSLVSNDGITFTLESGVRFSGSTRAALDPSLIWIGDTLHYFAGGGAPDRNWHASSVDGLNFVPRPDFAVDKMMMSNGIAVPGGYRFYGFTNTSNDIRSIFTSDGVTWTKEAGSRLTVDPKSPLESNYVKDPAIVLRDSLFLMYYVTRKKEFSDADQLTPAIEASIVLGDHYPNPVSSHVTIPFSVHAPTHLTISISDVLGRVVSTIADDTYAPGNHDVIVDVSRLHAGWYQYSIQTPTTLFRRMMIVVK